MPCMLRTCPRRNVSQAPHKFRAHKSDGKTPIVHRPKRRHSNCKRESQRGCAPWPRTPGSPIAEKARRLRRLSAMAWPCIFAGRPNVPVSETWNVTD
jgi:hypothetical protein